VHHIGEVAESVGLSLRTIRHYDDVGLVPPSGRSAGGFRLYTDEDIERLGLIKAMKPLDFSLEEMRDLLDTKDRLAETLTTDQRAALIDRLRMYALSVEQRCEGLRDRLDAAEALAATLQHDARPDARRRR
jgi:DNA-binding transcriptional MerR regulator